MKQPFAVGPEALQLLRLTVRINCHCSVLNSKLDAIRSLYLMHGEPAQVPPAIELLPLETLKQSALTEPWELALQQQESKLSQVQQSLLALLR